MSRADELRAELELLELEDDFVRAKESGDVTMEQKLELREARKEFRQRRAGGAQASPDAIEVSTGIAQIGS